MRVELIRNFCSCEGIFSGKTIGLLVAILLWNCSILNAEGTKQLSPTPNDNVNLAIGFASSEAFGTYNGDPDERFFIHIENPNDELVYLGFSQPVNYANWPCFPGFCCIQGENVQRITGYFRIKDPAGNIVFGPQILDASTSPVSSWAEAVAGPNQIIGTGGYNAMTFDPSGLASGDYYIEFSRDETLQEGPLYFDWWDVTVGNKTSNSAIDGRIFSKQWSFYAPDTDCNTLSDPYGAFDRPFVGSFHIYSSEDGIVSKVDFNGSGLQPAFFNVFFNNFGTVNTGDVCEDRKSLNATRAMAAFYPLFLNDPDSNVYPSGDFGTFSSLPFVVSCDGQSGEFYIEITKSGQVDILIDLDDPGAYTFTPGTRDVSLVVKVEPVPGESAPYLRKVPWDGLDGLGNQIDLTQQFNFSVTYSQGIFHLPIYDSEFMLNGFSFETIRPVPPPTANPFRIYYDDSNIPFSPGTGAPKVELNGCNAPCHNWNNLDYGNLNTINTWFFGSEDRYIADEPAFCPVDAMNDFDTTFQGVLVAIDVIANDGGQWLDTSSVTTAGVLQPSNGTITGIDSNAGEISYLPNLTFVGNDTFQYSVCDTTGLVCNTQMVVVTVNPVLLETNEDFDTVSVSSAVIVDVLLNDTGGAIDASSVSTAGVNGSANGVITNIDPLTGEITYQSSSNFVGNDTFQYSVCDTFNIVCDTVNVFITINPLPIVAKNDHESTDQGAPVSVSVLSNDLGQTIDSSSVSTSGGVQPSGGMVIGIDPVTGEIFYQPISTFIGIDSFEYVICDIFDIICDTAKVFITVNPIPLVAMNDYENTNQGAAVSVDVLLNDVGQIIDSSSVSTTGVLQPAGGTILSIDPLSGEITYEPFPTFVGNDSFEYVVCDTFGITCDTALVVVMVHPILLNAENDTLVVNQGAPVIVNVITNDTGMTLDTSSVSTSGVLQPTNGTITGIDPATGEITYLPDPTFVGTDSFEYVVCDTSAVVCDTAKVQITVNSNFPVARDDVATTFYEVDTMVFVLLNDSDPDGDTLSLIGAGTDTQNGLTSIGGLVSLNDAGTPGDRTDDFIDYSPPIGYLGLDTFSYQISDEYGNLDTAQVVITILILTEDCSNGTDDDLDGLIDCEDPDCGLVAEIVGDCQLLEVLNPQIDWTYQWRLNGAPISGAAGATLVPSPRLFGNYSVEITNGNGCAETSNFVEACCNPTGVIITGE